LRWCCGTPRNSVAVTPVRCYALPDITATSVRHQGVRYPSRYLCESPGPLHTRQTSGTRGSAPRRLKIAVSELAYVSAVTRTRGARASRGSPGIVTCVRTRCERAGGSSACGIESGLHPGDLATLVADKCAVSIPFISRTEEAYPKRFSRDGASCSRHRMWKLFRRPRGNADLSFLRARKDHRLATEEIGAALSAFDSPPVYCHESTVASRKKTADRY